MEISGAAEPNLKLKLAITILAILAVLVRILIPEAYERIDLVSLVLIGIALLPWLSSLFVEIKVPGFFEARFRDTERKLAAIQDDVQGVINVAVSAQVAAVGDSDDSAVGERNARLRNDDDLDGFSTLFRLSKQYVDTRRKMQGGPQRTKVMTKIFSNMVSLAKDIKNAAFVAATETSSEDEAEASFLAEIAWHYANPSNANVERLVEIVDSAKQPFVVYWGLLAIRVAIDSQGGRAVSLQDRLVLGLLKDRLPRGTDRWIVLSSILTAFDRIN